MKIVLFLVLVSSVSSKPDICKQPIDRGYPNRIFSVADLVYGYDKDKNKCVEFFYRGFGGNENRFDYKVDCEKKCVQPTEKEPFDENEVV
ncbi:unnamed protein product [Cylicocyclus nassatus]|uniref:BPTI/Kunitz inhibitor domain-containing protein n=1 Tax=Cylicocyclus nassatus TaxID=53992 RepID=A0AA36HCL8_CYLNA|nr:unnamed protein product [Cylicocyclus nassatus]